MLPEFLHDTVLVLILKKRDSKTVSDLRPIALCEVFYKIVSKMLSNRLKCILNDIISYNQSAFFPHKHITDNIMVSYEVMHYMNRKTKRKHGFATIKIDIRKDYDQMEWGYLEAILHKMGFADKVVSLYMTCMKSVK